MLQRVFSAIVLYALAGTSPAQIVFREDFNPGSASTCDLTGGAGNLAFPAGWLLRNVDNRIPGASSAWVNDAWEAREDFGGDASNCVAFSNSFHTPNGPADDWMWSPPVAVPNGAILRWRARTYDPDYRDGYEVRVMSASSGPPTGGNGVIGNQVANSSLLLTVAAENTTWTPRQVSLAGFAGQSVYIGFRNNSNDKFLLVIDDVDVAAEGPDLSPVAPIAPGPWARIPSDLARSYLLGMRVTNTGTQAANSVNVSAMVLFNGQPVGSALASNTLDTVGIGATIATVWPVQFPAPIARGTYVTRYTIAAATGELNPADNSIDSLPLEVGGAELSRYFGPVVRTLGIGAGNGGELATTIEVPATMTVAGVRLRMEGRDPVVPPAADRWSGRPIVARLRAADTNGVPLEPVLHETLPGEGSRAGVTYELAFPSPVTLPPGHYALSAVEPVDSEQMSVAMHAQIFQTGANRVTWPTSPTPGWLPLEDFGASFAGTPQIALLTRLGLLKDGFESPTSPPGAHSAAASSPALRGSGPQRVRLIDALND